MRTADSYSRADWNRSIGSLDMPRITMRSSRSDSSVFSFDGAGGVSVNTRCMITALLAPSNGRLRVSSS